MLFLKRKILKTQGEDAMPVELLVPIAIFVVFNVIMAVVLGGLGLDRLMAGQKAAGKNLASTAAYEAPFVSGQPKH